MNEKVSIDLKKFLELEYQQVRAEILKRIELRQQILHITLIVAGVLIGGGVQATNPLLSSIYPPLAFCFVMLWAQNDIRGRQLGQYIREEIEPSTGGLEKFYREKLAAKTMLGRYPLSIFAPGATFIISEFAAIIFCIFNTSNSARGLWLLIAIDVLALAGTVVLFRKALQNRERTLQPKATT